jgi:hypothetical protein
MERDPSVINVSNCAMPPLTEYENADCSGDAGGGTMKPTKPKKTTKTYERPTAKVSRLKRGKVLSVSERDAFVASRPDLKKPS